MEDELLVSIIIPVYNVERYLEECINSVINQDYANLEIIFVDDGSPDKSIQLLERYAAIDKRIIVIRQPNSGVSHARNAGIEASKGDYICFADSDDYLEVNYVSYLLDLAVKRNADISITTEMFSNFNLHQTSLDRVKVYSPERATAEILYYHIPIGVYCKMFKRDFISDKIRFISDLCMGEGFNFNTTAFQNANKIVVGQKKIYFYRRDNTESVTTKFSVNKWQNGLLALEKIRENLIIKSPKIKLAWQYANWHTHNDVLNLIYFLALKQQHEDMYLRCLNITRQKGVYALLIPVSFKEKARALITIISPSFIIKLTKVYRKVKKAVNL